MLRRRGPQNTSGPGALAGPQGHRYGDQQHDKGWQGVRRHSVLHPEQEALGKEIFQGGGKPLGDREPAPLATGRDVQRGSFPNPQRTCGCQLQHPTKDRFGHAQERNNQQGRDQKQTPHRRLGRRLPPQSACRRMTYGAIALPLSDRENNTQCLILSRHITRRPHCPDFSNKERTVRHC